MTPTQEHKTPAEVLNEPEDALLAEAIRWLEWARPLAVIAMEDHRLNRVKAGHKDILGTYKSGTTYVGIYQSEVDDIEGSADFLQRAKAALREAARRAEGVS